MHEHTQGYFQQSFNTHNRNTNVYDNAHMVNLTKHNLFSYYISFVVQNKLKKQE